MPLYRRLPFQRSSKERRSLHVPATGGQARSRTGQSSLDILSKTSIDLELDLAAQQSKLQVLSEEIERLRQIKKQMEEAKDKGEKELPVWLQEDEKFQYLLASVSAIILFFLKFILILFFYSSRTNLFLKVQKKEEWKNF